MIYTSQSTFHQSSFMSIPEFISRTYFSICSTRCIRTVPFMWKFPFIIDWLIAEHTKKSEIIRIYFHISMTEDAHVNVKQPRGKKKSFRHFFLCISAAVVMRRVGKACQCHVHQQTDTQNRKKEEFASLLWKISDGSHRCRHWL